MESLLKGIVLLLMVQTMSSLELVRDHIKDSLRCDDEIKCSLYNATQNDEKVCDCSGGTFLQYGNSFNCYKTTIKTPDCQFFFKNYEASIPSISVNGELAGEFSENIISKSITCEKLALLSVDNFDVGLLTWLPIPRIMDFTIIKSSSGTFSVRWLDPFRVNKTMYGGQLVKFNFICATLTGKKESKASYCTVGKIIGQRKWTDSSKLCSRETPAPTLSPHSTEDQEEGDKESKNMTVPLIGAIVAVILIIVLIVLAVVFCRKRNYSCFKKTGGDKAVKKKRPSLSDVRLASNGDYAEPCEIQFDPPLDSPTNFENKAYLTALRGDNNIQQYQQPQQQPSQTNNNKNYENFPYTDSTEGTKPLMTSSNDYEQILYEDPNNASTANYTDLTKPDQPEYHALTLQHAENDFYEEMSSKGGTA